MKIADVEEKLTKEGFSEELFLEFQSAIKRVPKASRSQHCYTLAYELSTHSLDGAIRLIEYGLNHCENTWQDQLRSYLNLGIIYENSFDYPNAKTAYQNALSAIPDTQQYNYVSYLSMNVLRTTLHINQFTYSREIETLYHTVCNADEFESNFRHFIFYKAIARMIVSANNQDPISHRAAYKDALNAVELSILNPLDAILSKHQYNNEAKATKEALEYLKSQRKDT